MMGRVGSDGLYSMEKLARRHALRRAATRLDCRNPQVALRHTGGPVGNAPLLGYPLETDSQSWRGNHV